MSEDLVGAAEELAKEIKGVAAVRSSSVSVTVVDGTLVVRCSTQPEGDRAIMMAIDRVAESHHIVVDVYLSR